MNERIDLREFLGAFVVEGEELVSTANTCLLEIEAALVGATSHPRAVRDLFRALHTIKGLASMIGVEPIVDIAHTLETLVRTADQAGGIIPRAAVDIVLQGVAAIAERVRAVGEDRVVEPAPPDLLAAIAATDAIAVPSVAVTEVPPEWEGRLSPSENRQLAVAFLTRAPVWTLSFCPSEANVARGITITSVRAQLGAIGDIVKVIPRSMGTTAEAKLGVTFDIMLISTARQSAIAAIVATDPARVIQLVQPGLVAAQATGERQEADDRILSSNRAVVRVELSRLDNLQEQLSLLIVSRLRLEREIATLAELGHDVRRLSEVARIQGRQLRDLRRAILSARMVKVAEVLEPLTLLVRSLARSGQREVQLELDAKQVELDKAVADRLLPALIHLVRNAVDHGIEMPERRVALGKPRVGTIRVSCVEVAGNLVQVVVGDDGRGIDRDEIAERAHRAVPDDEGLLAVLTSSGFSTRDVATMTSGRGVGMDIVRRIAVGELGGELSMTTEPGKGSTFTLRVPVTMSVMDVLSFVCGPQSFVVPALVVEEIIEVAPSVARMVHRDDSLPLVSLGAMLAIDSGAAARKALIVRSNGESIAFTVDRVIARQEVVVRTIDDPLVAVPGIAGATDLGDGRPTLVLDLQELALIAAERGLS